MFRLNNINLSTKIVASMFFIIFGMGVISVSSYIGFTKIGNEMEEIVEYQIPIESYIVEVETDILEEEILTYKFFLACRDVLSEEFKFIEERILKFERKTQMAITNTKKIVNSALNNGATEKAKESYRFFLDTLNILEKEQSIYRDLLIKLDENVKKPNYNNLTEDMNIMEIHLNKMDALVIKLVKKMEGFLLASAKNTTEHEHLALRVIEIISVIVLIMSVLLAFFLSRFVKSSINSFQSGLVEFFKYLNKEVESVKLLDDKKTDEIGKMAKVVNQNIKKIEKTIEDDKHVIENTITVLAEFEKGDLHKRVESTSSNESLMHLKDLLNNMASKLEQNIENILFVLSEFSKERYVDEVQASDLKEHFLRLAMGINELGDKVSESLIQRRNTANGLQETSSNLKYNMKNLSESSLEAATSLEETSAALEEIIRTMASNTDNIAQMRVYASKVTDSANKGEKLATNTMNAMDDINEQTNAIAESITIIDQIAFQTNILSLNAAVEAATAGEAGKGFAVVAGEVRNLATRSAEAAREIKELVENATTKADVGKSTAKEMHEEYEELNKGIRKTLELIKNVDEASKEQQLGVEQINDAVSQLDTQTQQNSAIATESDEIAENTLNISNEILDEVNEKEFKGK